MRRIVCVKLKDDIHNPGETNGQIMALKEQVKTRYWPGLRKAGERWVNACLACLQVKDPRKMKFPLKSVESSEFNEAVQIDHQKIFMTDSG